LDVKMKGDLPAGERLPRPTLACVKSGALLARRPRRTIRTFPDASAVPSITWELLNPGQFL
jgi:hypothetical protein